MDSFLQPASYFSLQTQSFDASSGAPWYAEDNISDCSQLPSPVTPDSTDFYLDPQCPSLSSDFTDNEYNSMFLFDNSQVQDWLSDPNKDLDMSSPFSIAVASPIPQRKHESMDIDRQAADFQRYPESLSSSASPSAISDVDIPRHSSQDMSLSAAEVQRLTAIAMGRLPPPSSPNLKPSQNLPQTETAPRRVSKTEVTSSQQPPKSDRKRTSGRASVVSPASKGKTTKKTSHNQIEKKYRTNLNSKIAELRDCIPQLRAQRISDSDEAGKQDDCHVSKASVLTAAIKLIYTLEKELGVQKRAAMDLRLIAHRYQKNAVESAGLYV